MPENKVDPKEPPSAVAEHDLLSAVLVGVEDYTTHANHGGADLAGAVADLGLWQSVLERMGGHTFTRLTAPTGGGLGNARRNDILDAFRLLVGSLSGDEARHGVFVFSGHGIRIDGKRYLAPSDTDATADNVIGLQDLLGAARIGPNASLTIVLDCCFSDVDARSVRLSGLRLRSLRLPEGPADAGRRDRETLKIPPGVTVVGAGDDTFEHYGTSGWIGSFSFAATTVLERWTPYAETDDGGRQIGTFWDLAYDRWVEGIEQVLAPIRLPSRPGVLAANPERGQLAVFQTPRDAPKPTSARPTSNRRPIQLDPGVDGLLSYDVTTPAGVVGTVVAVGASPPSNSEWTPQSEYWDVNLAALGGQSFALVEREQLPARAGSNPDRWRVNTAVSSTTVNTGTLQPGYLWKLQGFECPTFKIERANLRTTWIRSVVETIGESQWDRLTTAFDYKRKYRTVDTHVAYTT